MINPEISTLNAAVASWSDIELLFFGIDGRWRRLSLGDLGLSESLLYADTFGSGELSGDGRWWAASSSRGVVAVNLATGATYVVPTRAASVGTAKWVPKRHTVLVNGSEITIPDGVVTPVPYGSGSVGHEPDGTPLSLERGPDGEAILVEWHGTARHERAVIEGVTPPRREIAVGTSRRLIPADQLRAVHPTREQLAVPENRGRHGLAVAVLDSTSGDQVGRLTWTRRDFELSYHDVWLDDETLLVATVPFFVAWRPSTGELFRVTDARSLANRYWEISLARGQLAR